jgi:hypothetical protein
MSNKNGMFVVPMFLLRPVFKSDFAVCNNHEASIILEKEMRIAVKEW